MSIQLISGKWYLIDIEYLLNLFIWQYLYYMYIKTSNIQLLDASVCFNLIHIMYLMYLGGFFVCLVFFFWAGGYQFVCFQFKQITKKSDRKIKRHVFDKFAISRYNNGIPCKNSFVFYLQNNRSTFFWNDYEKATFE